MPLSHPPGEAQVDSGFAGVDLAGERTKVAFLVMTLPYSDAVYAQAFPRECTESFQEGHKRAFEFFGGVPKRISYDNSRVAIAKITSARDRQLTREFLRLQSHYLFALPELQPDIVTGQQVEWHGIGCRLGQFRLNWALPGAAEGLLFRLVNSCQQALKSLPDGW
ncbi:DDE-type integrase/transposase/recombinase [Botrimarina hoheduenensis]|uniref:Integrase core domain protein n=1 Tax=Botrimarina hoheduenensis TaxID=2528000 RepID=A0A5C5W039_9BACT|nr:DDE-type integrase/transposase/recombinase [Botrimarina hoheduenensis]TWT43122.1 Integrase core domain protein [Botrimarina hoheduenensis]